MVFKYQLKDLDSLRRPTPKRKRGVEFYAKHLGDAVGRRLTGELSVRVDVGSTGEIFYLLEDPIDVIDDLVVYRIRRCLDRQIQIAEMVKTFDALEDALIDDTFDPSPDEYRSHYCQLATLMAYSDLGRDISSSFGRQHEMCTDLYDALDALYDEGGGRSLVVSGRAFYVTTTPHGARQRISTLRRLYGTSGLMEDTATQFVRLYNLQQCKGGDTAYAQAMLASLLAKRGTDRLSQQFERSSDPRHTDPRILLRNLLWACASNSRMRVNGCLRDMSGPFFVPERYSNPDVLRDTYDLLLREMIPA